MLRRTGAAAMLLALAGLGVAAQPAAAQVRTVDPNSVDADLVPGAPAASGAPAAPAPSAPAVTSAPAAAPYGASPSITAETAPTPTSQTYQKDDVVAAAEGVFGKGAQGLAGLIEKILRDQGEPVGYIAGREASGAIVVGLRYGSGTLTHKIEGQRKVYWTGPSVGFDLGGNASSVFVLVYNLFDSQQLFRRYPQAEGAVYVVGGFTATYLRRGDIVLIPIRLGVGWRLGVNAGYMKFTEKGRILPF